jgi:hypothetical protein
MEEVGRMIERDYVTNEAAPPIAIPDGTSVSKDPISGGTLVVNGAVPIGEDGHSVWRTLSDAEQTQRGERKTLSVGWNRRQALAHLRMTRTALLAATDFIELADGSRTIDDATRSALGDWRQKLRDLPATTKDPDDPTWPAPPVALSGLREWAVLWPELVWAD